MKGGGKVILTVGVVVFLLLIYVHQYFLLFQTSYAIDRKETHFGKQTEYYRRLRFEVEQLKAPRLLEAHMKQLDLNLSLPKEINIVKVPAPKIKVPIQVHEVTNQAWSGRFMNWVGRWVDVAQAKVDNE